MNKIASTLSAATFALACSGIAFAADQAQTQQPSSDKSGDYVAELKKCEPLTGEAKQKCIDTTKKKFGEM
jgi:hypothetical protein